MDLAFNFGTLLVATGLARTGLTATPPTSIPKSIDDIIAHVIVLTTATTLFASDGSPGSVPDAVVCLGLFHTTRCQSSILIAIFNAHF